MKLLAVRTLQQILSCSCLRGYYQRRRLWLTHFIKTPYIVTSALTHIDDDICKQAVTEHPIKWVVSLKCHLITAVCACLIQAALSTAMYEETDTARHINDLIASSWSASGNSCHLPRHSPWQWEWILLSRVGFLCPTDRLPSGSRWCSPGQKHCWCSLDGQRQRRSAEETSLKSQSMTNNQRGVVKNLQEWGCWMPVQHYIWSCVALNVCLCQLNFYLCNSLLDAIKCFGMKHDHVQDISERGLFLDRLI